MKLAAQAQLEASTTRNAAHDKYRKIESDLVEAALEVEEALPKKLRDLCARLRDAGDACADADKVLDAQWREATAASDAYEQARTT